MSFDKPFKTYDELLDGLIEKNLIIPKSDRSKIINIFKNTNYYSIINAYKDIFLLENSKEEKFPYGLTFWDIYRMYQYDREVQRITFHYIMNIENSFKTKLAYVVADNFGVKSPKKHCYILWNRKEKTFHKKVKFILNNSYLDPKQYNGSANFFRGLTKNIYKTKNNPTKYYRDGNDVKPPKNHIPPWIAFQNSSFYYITQMCKNLKYDNKTEIGSYFRDFYSIDTHESSYSHLMDMLSVVYEFRNQIAHGQRFYNFKTSGDYSLKRKTMNKVYNEILCTKSEYTSGIGKNDFYAFLISLVSLLNNKTDANEFLGELRLIQKKFDNDDVLLQATNLPEDYLERLHTIYE